MPEPIVLNEDEETLFTEATSRPLRIQCARYISTIFSPAVVSIPFIVLVALYRATNMLVALGHAFVALLFLSAGPLLYIMIGVRMGKFSDVDVSVRAQRSGPFLFGIGSTLIGLCMLLLLNASKSLETTMLILIISGLVMMIITLWWKISIHASSLAGAATMLTALYGTVVLPTFLLLGMVCWSRVVLRRHTTAQVIGGSILSIVIALIALTIWGI
jgi:membrane-associated phospholipid phosphatase